MVGIFAIAEPQNCVSSPLCWSKLVCILATTEVGAKWSVSSTQVGPKVLSLPQISSEWSVYRPLACWSVSTPLISQKLSLSAPLACSKCSVPSHLWIVRDVRIRSQPPNLATHPPNNLATYPLTNLATHPPNLLSYPPRLLSHPSP
jgi:hypothetical protein